MIRGLQLLVLGVVAGLAGALAGPSAAGAAPAGKDRPSAKVRELLQERAKALEEQLDGLFERVKLGKDSVSTLVTAYQELAEVEVELADSPAAEGKALERAADRLRQAEADLRRLWMAGLQTKQGVAEAKAARLKAEIQLQRWKERR